MKFSESSAKVCAALVKAQAEMPLVGKGGENKFDKYSYARLEDYIRAASPVLVKHGLGIVTSVFEATAGEPRTTKNGGTEHVVGISMSMRLVHESGEWIEVEMRGEGQDRADKSTYKATTGARKYAVAMLLGLATSDDPEADGAVGTSTPPPGKAPATRPVAGNDKGGFAFHRDRMLGAARMWAKVKPEGLNAVCREVAAEIGCKLVKEPTAADATVADEIEKRIKEQVPYKAKEAS